MLLNAHWNDGLKHEAGLGSYSVVVGNGEDVTVDGRTLHLGAGDWHADTGMCSS